jgi:hypothetical protein
VPLHDPDQRCRSAAAKSGAWHQDGSPTSKLPGSPPSFSAWLCSPSSCCPLGETAAGQDEQITGDSPDAGLAPLLLALPPHRRARRVLRLEPRPRPSAAIGRIHPLRHDMLSEPDRIAFGAAEKSGENILLERCVRAGLLAGAGIPARISRRSNGCPNPPLMPRWPIALI